MISWPVCPGIKHSSGACNQILITVWQSQSCSLWALSLTRGWVCPLHMLLFPASTVPLGSETTHHCLKFETSLFFASYESQGHGGGIQTCLHMGRLSTLVVASLYNLSTDYTEHTTFDSSSTVASTSVAVETCLPSYCLAMDQVIISQYYTKKHMVIWNYIFSSGLALIQQ
jgi:hypothetical protein